LESGKYSKERVSGMNMKHPHSRRPRPTKGNPVETTKLDITKVLLQCGIKPERWEQFVSSATDKRS